MQAYLDDTGGSWAKGDLLGKVGGAFGSSATQHGSQESTLHSFHTELLHHGFVLVGLPYAWQGQMGHEEVSGGTSYGANSIAGAVGQAAAQRQRVGGGPFLGLPHRPTGQQAG